jgi:2-methylcitrate dehydratase PrpD
MITRTLADHIATAPSRPLPREVADKTALHILDTIAAIVSGARLPAGERIIPFVAGLGGNPEATVLGSGHLTCAIFAALANGMCAHADETDDSHAPSLTHPGCAVIPAALAMAERERRSGPDFLRAVAVGYDVGPRVSMALGADRFFDRHHSSHGFGGLFGATAGASAAAGLNCEQAAYALGYAVQLAGGNACWRRDPDHVEKAFDFAGMPAQNGVLAASFAHAGFTASSEPFEGQPGLFAAFPEEAQPDHAVELLGERYEVMRTAIKKWCVGSPIQAALDSLEFLMREHRLSAPDIDSISVALPRQSAPVVDNRSMPDVNLQQQMAVMLLDGGVTFHSSHDRARMHDAAVAELRGRIHIDPRDEETFKQNSRQAWVTVRLKDGRNLEHRTFYVRGTPNNPMSSEEVVTKCRDLMAPILGEKQTNGLIERVLALDMVQDVTELRPLLIPSECRPSR